VDDAVRDAVRDAVGGAVDGAVRGAVDDAVRGAVDDAVRDAVRDAVGGAVDGAVRGAVDDAVRGAVDDAVRGAVDGAVGDRAIRQAVSSAISRMWTNYLGGQFWVSGWWWGTAFTSFFREVCGLELSGDLWERGRAYENIAESACWWYPHRDFVMACERPTAIHRELVNPNVTRGWGSHRLHSNEGPAVSWPDGWGVYAVHGVRLPFAKRHIVEAPHLITREEIDAEQNAEIRRVMIERYGADRYLLDSEAKIIQRDRFGLLYRKEVPDDEPIVMVRVLNSTPEPDGVMSRDEAIAIFGEAAHCVIGADPETRWKQYMLRCPPNIRTAHEAIAWSFNQSVDDYHPALET
jgi:hypothetical protein